MDALLKPKAKIGPDRAQYAQEGPRMRRARSAPCTARRGPLLGSKSRFPKDPAVTEALKPNAIVEITPPGGAKVRIGGPSGWR
jgi:hypothetical protein